MPNKEKIFSIVILNWNGAAMLRRFLPHVLATSRSNRFGVEVIVADNGSSDASCSLVRKEFPDVRLIEMSQNYGFAEGYNRALQGLEARYYILLNSDVRPASGWLEPLFDFMEQHGEVAACAPKLLSEKAPEWFEYAGASGGFIDRWGYPCCRGRVFGTVEKDLGQYDDAAPVLWASGAALCIRRADWESAGGLDGDFFAHQEEIDLCWRLRNRGRGVWIVPESKVFHVGGATLSKESPRKTYLNFRNNLLLLYKNVVSEAELRKILRLRRLLDYVAAAQFLAKGQMRNAWAVRRARRDFRRLRPAFRARREANCAACTGENVPEVLQLSLLVQYYLKGRRTFSAICTHVTRHT